MGYKECKACRNLKPLSDFSKDKYVKGGYKHKCKNCVKSKIKNKRVKWDFKLCYSCYNIRHKQYFSDNIFELSGLSKKCNICVSEDLSLKSKERYMNNKESYSARSKEYYIKNKEVIKERVLDYYFDNKDVISKYKKEWAKKNSKNIYEKRKNRRLKDKVLALTCDIRSKPAGYLKRFLRNNFTKNELDFLGCTISEFKVYIESQFYKGISWDNFNVKNGWELDHVIPMSLAENEEDVLNLNHYSNFQPLCSYTNRHIKKDNNPMVCNIIKKELNKFCNE